MASQSYISFSNLAKTATITVSSEASGYPKANLQEPELLGLPWRATVATDSWIVIDLGSAIPFDRLSLIGANVTSVKIQQHTSDSWGAPAYDSGTLTIGRDPDQRLYRLTVASGGNFTRRFTRIVIPTQTPVSGSTFELAGIHLGNFTTIPHGIAVFPGYRAARARPFVSHRAQLGGWSVAYPSGDTFSTPRYSRFAAKSTTTPGIGDEYASWLAIDRQIDAAPKGIFCLALPWLGPGAVGMFRQVNDHDWQDDGATVMRDAWDLDEASVG